MSDFSSPASIPHGPRETRPPGMLWRSTRYWLPCLPPIVIRWGVPVSDAPRSGRIMDSRRPDKSASSKSILAIIPRTISANQFQRRARSPNQYGLPPISAHIRHVDVAVARCCVDVSVSINRRPSRRPHSTVCRCHRRWRTRERACQRRLHRVHSNHPSRRKIVVGAKGHIEQASIGTQVQSAALTLLNGPRPQRRTVLVDRCKCVGINCQRPTGPHRAVRNIEREDLPTLHRIGRCYIDRLRSQIDHRRAQNSQGNAAVERSRRIVQCRLPKNRPGCNSLPACRGCGVYRINEPVA